MKKCISTAALTAVVAMFSQVQASQAATVEERLEAVEKKLEGTSSGNFITAAKKKVDVTLYGQVNTGTGIAGSSHTHSICLPVARNGAEKETRPTNGPTNKKRS